MLRPEQRDAPFERLAFVVELRQLCLGELDLLREAQPGEQPAITLHQVVSEITHQAYAEDRASNQPGASLDLLENHHARRESRASHRVNYLLKS